MKRIKLFFFLFSISNIVLAQTHTISGYVLDEKSSEKLINANVYDSKTYKGCLTNDYGFFSLTMPEGSVHFSVSYIGYGVFQLPMYLTKDTFIQVKLVQSVDLQEVIVEDEAISHVRNTQMSVQNLQSKTIARIPAMFGQVDVLKAIQLLPGIKGGVEGSSGIYVRGGGPDQNLFLLDGVPVYNVNHLFGFFSVFNNDALSNVKVLSGGFPASYGGRVSSVVDIRMKEGNAKKLQGSFSIGIISSQFTLEGPIKQDTTSFIISARRTYIDALIAPFLALGSSFGDEKFRAGYFFQDYNLKINHKISQKSRLYLSVYTGNDKAYTKVKTKDELSINYSKMKSKLTWGNITTALRWNYVFNPRLFCNTTLTYSRYRFLIGLEEEMRNNNNLDKFALNYTSGIYDWAEKVDFDFYPNSNHSIKFGVNHIYHTFNPGVSAFKTKTNDAENNLDTTFGSKKIFANEFAIYGEDEIDVATRFKLNAGVRLSGFYVNSKWYNALEPRFSCRYLLNDSWSIKAGTTKMYQYIHLLTNTNIGFPTDLWVPVTSKIKPQEAWQYNIGTTFVLPKGLEMTIEGYYKEMKNMIEYKEGASFFSLMDDWQDKVEVDGSGTAYGVEFLLQKTSGKFSGWIGYTLSWAWRQFDNISFGERYPFRYDRRHDISFVLAYDINESVDMGFTWVYGTGNAVTLPLVQYQGMPSIDGFNNSYFNVEYFENRNNWRMPSYHRMDVSINLHKQKKRGIRTWTFAVYNAYNRQNPFYVDFQTDYDNYGNSQKVLKQYSLFPIIPSFSYNFKF